MAVDQAAVDFGTADEFGCMLVANSLNTNCQQSGDIHACFAFVQQF
jgi:hypothetical protein